MYVLGLETTTVRPEQSWTSRASMLLIPLSFTFPRLPVGHDPGVKSCLVGTVKSSLVGA